VPHLPCRFDCPATVALADQLIAVGRDGGFGHEMDWLMEMLSWPVEWSALHGIAEIKTPVLKVSAQTDATAVRYVVRRKGDDHPSAAGKGLSLPYRAPVKLRLSGSRGHRRGLDNAAARARPHPAWFAADNGFASVAAMHDAHRPIVDAANRLLDGRGGDVVDLGCGNGALLASLMDAAPGIMPFGIDLDSSRIAHARTLHPAQASNFFAGDLFDDSPLWTAGRRYALALLMPGRLLEAQPVETARLRRRLSSCCDRILVYAYPDWLSRAGSLGQLAGRAGLTVVGAADQPAALATVAINQPKEAHGI